MAVEVWALTATAWTAKYAKTPRGCWTDAEDAMGPFGRGERGIRELRTAASPTVKRSRRSKNDRNRNHDLT